MMNEGRLELRENLGKFLHRIVILRRARIQPGKGLGNQLAGQLDQRQRMLVGGIHEQVAVVDHLAAAVVVDLPVKVDSGHEGIPLQFTQCPNSILDVLGIICYFMYSPVNSKAILEYLLLTY